MRAIISFPTRAFWGIDEGLGLVEVVVGKHHREDLFHPSRNLDRKIGTCSFIPLLPRSPQDPDGLVTSRQGLPSPAPGRSMPRLDKSLRLQYGSASRARRRSKAMVQETLTNDRGAVIGRGGSVGCAFTSDG